MKRKNAYFWNICMQWSWMHAVRGLFLIFAIGNASCASVVNADTVPARRPHYETYNLPTEALLSRFNYRFPRGKYVQVRSGFPVPKKNVFRMEPSDALDSKWSQPVSEHRPHEFHTDHIMTKPSVSQFNTDMSAYTKQIKKNVDHSDTHALKTTSTNVGKEFENTDGGSIFPKSTLASDYKTNGSVLWLDPRGAEHRELGEKESSLLITEKGHLSRNNFTDSNDSQILGPSNSVYDFQLSSDVSKNSESKLDLEHMPQSDSSYDVTGTESTQNASNILTIYATDTLPYDRDALQKEKAITRTLFEASVPPRSTGSEMLEYLTSTESFVTNIQTTLNYTAAKVNNSEENVDSFLPTDSTVGFKLSSGAVTGIVIAVLVCVTLITSAVIYLLYRRYSGKCTSVVDGKYNSDNCGYLDDSLRSSIYLNNHIELPKENSEEMTSLDNDSFLNSLETMTIQNYWADNTKNTKV